MNGTTIITRSREMLNEPTANFFTDAEILAWANLGYKKIIAETGYYQQVKTLASVANQQEYSPASDVSRIRTVRWEDDFLQWMDWRDYIQFVGNQSMTQYSNPTHIIDYNATLYLFPAPSASATTTTLNGTLTTAATSVTVGSTSDFPDFGAFIVNSEVVNYTGKTTVSFTGLSRAKEGSTAVQHASGDTLTERDITYYFDGVPSDIVAATSPVFPEPYHELLVWYAVWMGKMKKAGVNEAKVWKQFFDEGLERMKRWWKVLRPRPIKDGDSYPTIKP